MSNSPLGSPTLVIPLNVQNEVPVDIPLMSPDDSLSEDSWLAEVLLTLTSLHPQDVEAGSEATGDGDVTDLDKAAPLVILDQNSAQHSLER